MPRQILHAGDSPADDSRVAPRTLVFPSLSLDEKRVGPTNDDSYLHAAGALPESDDVSLNSRLAVSKNGFRQPVSKEEFRKLFSKE